MTTFKSTSSLLILAYLAIVTTFPRAIYTQEKQSYRLISGSGLGPWVFAVPIAKETDPLRRQKGIEQAVKADFQARQKYRQEETKRLEKLRVRFRIFQKVGLGSYLVNESFGGNRLYHLTLLYDIGRNTADGALIDVYAKPGGIFTYTDVNGATRRVNKFAEVDGPGKLPKPKKRTEREIEQRLRNGEKFTLEVKQTWNCPKCGGAKLVGGRRCNLCKATGTARVTVHYRFSWLE